MGWLRDDSQAPGLPRGRVSCALVPISVQVAAPAKSPGINMTCAFNNAQLTAGKTAPLHAVSISNGASPLFSPSRWGAEAGLTLPWLRAGRFDDGEARGTKAQHPVLGTATAQSYSEHPGEVAQRGFNLLPLVLPVIHRSCFCMNGVGIWCTGVFSSWGAAPHSKGLKGKWHLRGGLRASETSSRQMWRRARGHPPSWSRSPAFHGASQTAPGTLWKQLTWVATSQTSAPLDWGAVPKNVHFVP